MTEGYRPAWTRVLRATLGLSVLASLGLTIGCIPSWNQALPAAAQDRSSTATPARPEGAAPHALDFGLIGDLPYSYRDETQAQTVLQA